MLRAMVRIADGGPLATCSTWQYTPIGKEPACERGRATRGPVCCAAASTSRPLASIGSPTSSRKRKPSRKVVPTVRPPWDPDEAAIALESSDRTTCATRPFVAGRPEFSWPYRGLSLERAPRTQPLVRGAALRPTLDQEDAAYELARLVKQNLVATSCQDEDLWRQLVQELLRLGLCLGESPRSVRRELTRLPSRADRRGGL